MDSYNNGELDYLVEAIATGNNPLSPMQKQEYLLGFNHILDTREDEIYQEQFGMTAFAYRNKHGNLYERMDDQDAKGQYEAETAELRNVRNMLCFNLSSNQ